MQVYIVHLEGAELTIRDFEDAFVRALTDPDFSEVHFTGVGKKRRWYSFQPTSMGVNVTKDRL